MSNSGFKTAILASVSAIVVAMASSAQAQAISSDQPEPPVASTAQSDDNDIVVTGIRESIARAQDLKRRAPAVIEAITSQDLGKFADQSLGDSLQRVPGIQIQRNDDGRSGDKISIRGLGPQYVNVAVNGRDVVSYGDAGNGATPNVNLRSFNLDAVPTEVIGGLVVYKTPIAENPDTGLAGLLDIKTIRPLDYVRPKGQPGSDKVFGSLFIRGEGDTLRKTISPRFSGAFGAKLFGDTLGIFLSGVHADTRRRSNEVQVTQAQRSITIAGQQYANVLAPIQFDNYAILSKQERRALTGAVQWRPTSQLEVNLDLTYNRYNNDQERQRNEFDVNTTTIYDGNQASGDLTIANGVVTGFKGSRGGVSQITYRPEPSFETNDSKSIYGGANVKWHDDRTTVALDYGHSQVSYFSNLQVLYGQLPMSLDYALVDGKPTFSGVGFSSAQIALANYYGGQKKLESSNDSLRLDLARKLGDDFTLKLGGRVKRTTVDSRTGGIYAVFTAGQPTLVYGSTTLAPVYSSAQLAAAGAATFPLGGRYASFPQVGLNALQLGDFAAGCAAVNEVCGVSILDDPAFSGAFPTTAAANTGGIAFSGGNSFYTREKNYAGYAQLDGAGQLFGIPVEGNAGVRIVRIDLAAKSFAQVSHRGTATDGNVNTSTVNTPTSDTNAYTRVLPSVNLNLHPSDQLAIRLGVSRSMSLPQYEDSRPSGTIIIQDIDPNGVRRSNANFNNTRLKPIMQTSYDLTAEFYTGNRGSVVLSLFYKDVTDFILNTLTSGATLPGQPGVFDLTGPQNVASGSAKGFEIGANQPFSFLPSPFDGLGVQANYTYVDAKFNSALPEAQFGMPGASKHNVNIIAYYEKYGLGVRLGYTYRSDNLLGLGGSGYGFSYPTFEAAHSNLDLTVTYAIDSRTELSLNAANLTRAERRDYQVVKDATFAYHQRPVSFNFGIRRTF